MQKQREDKMIYFDNAASSFPKPITVSKAMIRAVNVYGANPGRSGHFLSCMAEKEVFSCRNALADMFNTESENIIFTANCTASINLALKGFLKPKSEVLISDMEHNAVVRPLEKMKDVFVKQVEIDLYDDEKTVENFKNAITNKTSMIAITACSNVIGKITPIEKIGKLCKENNIKFLVDAAQLGGVMPIDIKKCSIDFLALAPHKSLFGVQGLGVLVLNDKIKLDTLIEGGTGTNSESPLMPDFPPERYEAGTIATPAIVALKAGISFIKERGILYIKEYENNLALYTFNLLKDIDAILYTKKIDDTFSGVLPFNIKNATPNLVSDYLDKNGIMTRAGYHCAYPTHKKIGSEKDGAVRLSFTVFNTKEQINVLIKKLVSFSRDIL
ncbi:MAG: aminotransferase class V-fold PLP-dependent enzyme [Clostridia bacterium]